MKRTFLLLLLALCIGQYANATNAGLKLIRYGKNTDKYGRLVHQGDSVTFRGIVQSTNIPSTSRGYFFSIYDSTSSITIYMDRSNGPGFKYTYVPTLGDSIEVSGVVEMYIIPTIIPGKHPKLKNDSTGFAIVAPYKASGFDITVLNSSNTVHNATIIRKFSEKEESNLLELDSFTMINSAQWTTPPGPPGSFGTINIRNVNDTTIKLILRVDGSIISANKAPLGVFNVKGIEFQYDTIAPFKSSYRLMPRDYADFNVIIAAKIPLHHIGEVNHENTSGIADSLHKTVRLKGIVQSPNLLPYTNILLFSIFDQTGSITVYSPSSNFAYTPTIGDSFFVEGQINQIFIPVPPKGLNTGWTVIQPDSIAIPSNSLGNPILKPEITTSFDDTLESKLIKLMNVKLADPTQWDTSGTFYRGNYYPKTQFYVDMVDANNTYTRACIERIDSLFYIPTPSGNFNITGILGQDTLSPAKFAIYPRFHPDIEAKMPYYKIVQVKGTDPNLKSTGIGIRGYLKGVAHSGNLSKTGLRYSLIDNTGAITVYSMTNTWGFVPMKGDSVYVYGIIAQINGLTVIMPDSMRKISSYNGLQPTGSLTSISEMDESYPRKFLHVKLKNASQWDTTFASATGGFMVTVQDTTTSDTMDVFISNGTTAYYMPAPNVAFNVAGIIQQNDATSPFTEGYYLEPRDSQDIWLLSKGVQGINEAVNNQIAVNVFPNPATDKINLLFEDLKGKSVDIKVYSITGQLILNEKSIGSAILNINSIAQGMYIIRMNTADGLQSVRNFVKE